MKKEKVKADGYFKGERRFRLAHEFRLGESDLEHPSSVSQTVPDQAFTVQDILDKYTQGVDIGNFREGVYDTGDADFDDVDLEKVPHMDQVERENLLDLTQQNQKQLNEKLNQSKTKKKREEPAPAKADERDPKPEGKEPNDKRSAKGGEEHEG